MLLVNTKPSNVKAPHPEGTSLTGALRLPALRGSFIYGGEETKMNSPHTPTPPPTPSPPDRVNK